VLAPASRIKSLWHGALRLRLTAPYDIVYLCPPTYRQAKGLYLQRQFANVKLVKTLVTIVHMRANPIFLSGSGVMLAVVSLTIGGCSSPESRQGAAAAIAQAQAGECLACELPGADLSGQNLKAAKLNRSNFSNAKLAGTDLSNALMDSVDLQNADLANANLSQTALTAANLAGANLKGADLSGAYLRGANLSGTDFTDANLTGANLASTNLSEAVLDGATLTDATLPEDFVAP